MALCEQLARFSVCYDAAHLLIYRRVAGLSEDNAVLLNDPLKAFSLFTMYAHERGGTNPNFGHYQRLSVIEAMGRRTFDDALQDSTFPDEVWRNFVRLTSGKPNAQITMGVVRDILVELRKSSEPNWIKLLKSMGPVQAFCWLDDLRGMAEKLSGFVVRDMATIMKLWRVEQEQMYLLQPLDIWVIDWSKRCWNTIFESTNGTLNRMKAVTEKCFSEVVDPAEFNKGAWFSGSYFSDICDFFGVAEVERRDRVNCVMRFDPDRLLHAITEYSRQRSLGAIFAP